MAAEISKEEVEKIAQLARLALTGDEITKMQSDLTSILAYVGQLQQIDVSGVEPTHHATGTKNVYREDKVDRPDDHTDKFLKNAPKLEGQQLKVQAVLEDRE